MKILIELISGKLVALPIGDVNGIAGLGADGKVPASQLPPSGGGGAWGSITGILSAQTDLQSALDAKALLAGQSTQDFSTNNLAVAGRLGINTSTPTAYLHLPAGGAFGGNIPPLKFTNGSPLIATAEAGAIEYDGTNFYATPASASRYIVPLAATTTANRIPFWSSISGVLTSSSGLVFVNSKLGLGVATPTAWLHMQAGTGSPFTDVPPLRLTAGTNTSGIQSGAIEFDGTSLYFSPSTSRKIISLMDSAPTVGYIPFATSTSTFGTDSNLFWDDINKRQGIGTNTPNARLDLADTVQMSNRILLSGQEFYQAGNTSTDGVAIRLGVNRSANRQLWIADSAAAIDSTNSCIRILVGTTAGINAISTDGTSSRDLVLQGSGGNTGIGVATPTARVHLPAGAASANSAPLKFTAGTNLTTAVAGAMEYDGSFLYFTGASTRRYVSLMVGVMGTGQIPFASTSGVTTVDAALAWDNTSKALHIGSGTLDASAILDLETTTKGFLPPRMTQVQRTSIVSPATGLVVFNTTIGGLEIYTGSSWSAISLAPSILAGYLTTMQSTDLAAGDHIKFGTTGVVIGSDVTLDTATAYTATSGVASIGRFTLAANKTYRLSADIGVVVGTSHITFGWYNVTTGTPAIIGKGGTVNTGSTSVGCSANIQTVITTSGITLLELRIINNSGDGITTIGSSGLNSYPSAIIETIA